MKAKGFWRMLALLCVLLGVLTAGYASAESADAQQPVILMNGQPVEEAVLNLSAGNQLQFTANQPVTWSSSKAYRGEIDQSGLLTGKSPGTIRIYATAADGARASCSVKIVRLATEISITGPDALAAGKRGTLKAVVSPSNAGSRKVTWSSSDESVVKVSSSGRITAQKVSGVRSAVITATARDGSGVYARHTVTVTPAAQTVSILAGGQPVKEVYLDISVGNPTMQLSAVVSPADASQDVKWKSSSSKRVSVDENGLITGLKTGTATITATAQDGTGRKATVKVRVVRMVTDIDIAGSASVVAGRSITLKATVSPSNATTKSVAWESSDTSVATVNKYGKVTAKKVDGVRTAVITARAKDGSGVYAQHTVTVTPAIDSMQITVNGQPVSGKLTMDIANPTIDLGMLIQPADACQEVVWKSSSAKRATVDENGVVTGLKTGTVKITATAQDGSKKKTTVTISIVRAVKSIAITGDAQLTGGKSGKLKAAVLPSNATNKSVTWESSNPEVVTVNKYGTIKAARVATRQQATIYAKAKDGSGVVGSIVVTVLPRATSVTVMKDGQAVDTVGIDLNGARTVQLTAKVGPEDANQEVTWKTSSKKRATVDQNGVVTGLKEGKVTITATAKDGSGVKAKVTVNVGVMVRNIAVTGPNKVTSGQKTTLDAVVSPSNATEKDVVWRSGNEQLATVSKYGVVTGGSVDAPASVTIYAEAKDGSGTVGQYAVTVIPAARSVSIARTDAGMPGTLILNQNGGTARLSASVYPASASQSVSWSSSNSGVATVSSSGVVTAHGSGRAKITARATDGSGVKAVLWVGVGDTAAMPYYLEVDSANQVVRIYERGSDGSYSHLIKRMICSTGKPSTPGLDYGLYPMNGNRMVWMTSVANSYALYATRIEGHILFHSVTYPTRRMDNLDAAAYEKLGSRASLGCIRLLAIDAKWIHDNVPEGCFVQIMEGVRSASEYGAVTKPALKSGKWDPTNPDPANPDYDPTYSSDVN